MDKLTPTRWWRVTRNGKVWCETSSEHDARSRMEPGDVLERLYTRSAQIWVFEETKRPRTP